MGTRLFVGNLSFETTEADLRGAFTATGLPVQEIKLVTERETGRPRGFAFVEMSTPAAAQQAMDALDGRELGGRQINVKEANERPGGGGSRRPR
jgi:cold-inducible RNA-binding protein